MSTFNANTLQWFGFWIFMSVLVFGITKCANDTYYAPSKSNYEICIKGCDVDGWDDHYNNLDCPIMCAETVSKLIKSANADSINTSLKKG